MAFSAKSQGCQTHTHIHKYCPIPKACLLSKEDLLYLLSSDQSALSSHSKYGEEVNEMPLEANFN